MNLEAGPPILHMRTSFDAQKAQPLGFNTPSAQVQMHLIHSPQPDTNAPSEVAALAAPSRGSCSWKGGLTGGLSVKHPAEPGEDGSVGKTSQLAELNFKDNEGDTC